MNIFASAVLFLLLIGFALLFSRRFDPAVQYAKAERKLRKGKTSAALKCFGRVITLVKRGKGKASDKSRLLYWANLKMGEIAQGIGARTTALDHYIKAWKIETKLPAAAVQLVAECKAEASDASTEAADIYLAYLKVCPISDPGSEKVLTALQGICQVAENMQPAQRRAAAELCQRVIAVNPNLEWTHYYCGLSSLLDGRAEEASKAFSLAQNLGPERALTYYWLAVCQLEKQEPDLDAAMAMIDRFLTFPSSKAKTRKREAKACIEIGKRLIEKLGNVDAAEDHSPGDRQAILAQAIHYLEVAVERQPDNAEYWFHLAKAYVAGSTTGLAIAALENAVRLSPNEKLYIYHLGVERNRAGDVDGAVSALEQALKVDGDWGHAHALLGEIEFRRGNSSEAELYLRAAIVQLGKEASLMAMLLLCLYDQTKYEQAISEVEALPALLITAEENPDAVLAIARSYAQLDKYEQAILWLQGLRQERRGLYYLGCVHAWCGQTDQARSCFDDLCAGEDDYAVKAILQLGHLLLSQGDAARAERYYRQVIERDSKNSRAIYSLGVLAFEREDLDESISMFEQALSFEPGSAEIQFALGVAQERRGNFAEALQNYQSSSLSEAHGSSASLRAGILHCRNGEFEQSLRCLEKCALEAEQYCDAFLFYRGSALALSGRFEEAIVDWSQLQERHPANERLALNLARAYYMFGAQQLSAGDLEGTLVSWEKYLQQYPNDERTNRDLAELHFRIAMAQLENEANPDISQIATHLKQAKVRDGENHIYSYYIALCELRLGNYAKCLTALKDLVDSIGEKPRILYHMALCLLHMGDKQEAMRILIALQSSQSVDGYARYAAWALANERVCEGKLEEAALMLEQAVDAFKIYLSYSGASGRGQMEDSL